ncbi:MAG TPA: hypothetical protein VF950_25630 [Planctomycetota bacterium]
MTRLILNVATGPYVPLQKRLLDSLRGADVLAWTDAWPPGSPAHAEAPYAFKLHAFAESRRRGATSALWLDAPVVASGDPAPVFERIERDGHLFVSSGDRLGNWIGDAALEALGLSRDAAMELPLLNGTFIGLEFRRGGAWLDAMLEAAAKGLLSGPYFTERAPAEARARKPGKPVGVASRDPRCWGHRHDEAIGSALARRLGMSIAPVPALFGTSGHFRPGP